jgi:hypothetical protein
MTDSLVKGQYSESRVFWPDVDRPTVTPEKNRGSVSESQSRRIGSYRALVQFDNSVGFDFSVCLDAFLAERVAARHGQVSGLEET